ncbi:unnamed protein product, partial [Acidithrix sp. C25]
VHVSFNAFKDPKVLIVLALLIGYGVLVTHMRVRRADFRPGASWWIGPTCLNISPVSIDQ